MSEGKLLSLLAKVGRYNPKADLKRVRSAYNFAKRAHQDQKRLSGRPFIDHALSVAHLIADLKLDEDSIVTALLHDVLDEGKRDVQLEEIEKEFGLDVALLADGVSNFRQAGRKFPINEGSVNQFRKFLLASIEDVRVLIIRLADKIHNARTLEALPKENQERFAKRVFHLYSPLAEYAGLGAYKRELGDKAFQILYSDDYQWLVDELEASGNERKKLVKQLSKKLDKRLKERKINYYRIFGRAKGLWSTYQKIQRYLSVGKIDQKDPAVILDKIGVTVLADDVDNCYAALGVIHSNWEYISSQLDDYIANPKPNGYQAIQTTISLRKDLTAEIQIKTSEMHEYNEFGPASHIAYKVMGKENVSDYSYQWVKELVSWRDKGKHKHYKVKVFEDYVYCLTPQGDILQLPKGSTPVDFAYQIHTEVGHSCSGAIVNGEMVKLSYQLQNGDLVEILTDEKRTKPNRNWLEFVQTKEAERRIRTASA